MCCANVYVHVCVCVMLKPELSHLVNMTQLSSNTDQMYAHKL